MMAKTAFLFSGQGVQKAGMVRGLPHSERSGRLLRMAETLKSDITFLLTEGSQEDLDRTVNAQPAMYLADLCYAYDGEDKGLKPMSCLGFSLGEIPALAYAGAFSAETGFKIVLERARLMEEYTQKVKGGMIAMLGLSRESAEQIAQDCGCWAVNFNLPTQTVAAAREENVSALTEAVQKNKGKAIRLKVAGAFHCELLKEAAEKFYGFLSRLELGQPKMPVYANETALPYCGDIAQNLSRQMMRPVEFYKSVQNMRADGIEEFYEAGPGGVLTALVKKIVC